MNTTMTELKSLFTDSEWQMIDDALSEFQDHLEDDTEIEIWNSIQGKLNAMFS